MAAVAVWWRAARPFSLTASVTPVVVGAAAAAATLRPEPLDLVRALVALLASVAIQVATNLANDYFDYVRGVDDGQSIGPSGVIQRGWIPARTVLRASLLLFALAAVLGSWLIAVVGWPVLVLGAAGALAGYAYTGGPVPLGYIGLGDLTVFLAMGPLIVLGTHYVLTGGVAAGAVWASLPVGALVTAILVVNNLRDIEGDRARGKRTLATIFGRTGTRAEYLLLVLAAYAVVLAGVALRGLPPFALITLATIPHALRTWRVVRREADPLALTLGGLRGTAHLHARFGGLLAIALFLPITPAP